MAACVCGYNRPKHSPLFPALSCSIVRVAYSALSFSGCLGWIRHEHGLEVGGRSQTCSCPSLLPPHASACWTGVSGSWLLAGNLLLGSGRTPFSVLIPLLLSSFLAYCPGRLALLPPLKPNHTFILTLKRENAFHVPVWCKQMFYVFICDFEWHCLLPSCHLHKQCLYHLPDVCHCRLHVCRPGWTLWNLKALTAEMFVNKSHRKDCCENTRQSTNISTVKAF